MFPMNRAMKEHGEDDISSSSEFAFRSVNQGAGCAYYSQLKPLGSCLASEHWNELEQEILQQRIMALSLFSPQKVLSIKSVALNFQLTLGRERLYCKRSLISVFICPHYFMCRWPGRYKSGRRALWGKFHCFSPHCLSFSPLNLFLWKAI